MEVQQIEEKLKTALKPSRYRHTLGVAIQLPVWQWCLEWMFIKHIAQVFYMIVPKVFQWRSKERYANDIIISLEGTLTKSPQLMHQEIAPFLASDEYKEQDSEVLSAIACHTTGKIGMTPLEQIVFIADYMELNRKMIPDFKSPISWHLRILINVQNIV